MLRIQVFSLKIIIFWQISFIHTFSRVSQIFKHFNQINTHDPCTMYLIVHHTYRNLKTSIILEILCVHFHCMHNTSRLKHFRGQCVRSTRTLKIHEITRVSTRWNCVYIYISKRVNKHENQASVERLSLDTCANERNWYEPEKPRTLNDPGIDLSTYLKWSVSRGRQLRLISVPA